MRGLQMLWNVKATVIPVVTGALGATNDNHKNHLRTTEFPSQQPACRKQHYLEQRSSLGESLSFQKAGNFQMSGQIFSSVMVMRFKINNNNDNKSNNNNDGNNNTISSAY